MALVAPTALAQRTICYDFARLGPGSLPEVGPSQFRLDPAFSLVSLNKTIPVVWSPTSRELVRDLSFVFIANKGDGESILLLRDMGKLEEQSRAALRQAFQEHKSDSKKPYYLLVRSDASSRSKQEPVLIHEFTELDPLMTEWDNLNKDPARCRFLISSTTAVVTIAPLGAEKLRLARTESFVRRIRGLTAELPRPEPNRDSNVASTNAILDAQTTGFFAGLAGDNLLNDKMVLYERVWQAKKPRMRGWIEEPPVAVDDFFENLALAAEGNLCTVTVNAKRGDGAEVHYAKKIDAAAGNFKTMPGNTMVIKDIERADYVFQAYRDGKQTGQTKDPVDCTIDKQIVTVPEP
jgi:hypothetical protein